MSPHDTQIAVTAWLAAIAAICTAAGAAWVVIYPVLAKMKRDIDALWAAHRAQESKADDRHT